MLFRSDPPPGIGVDADPKERWIALCCTTTTDSDESDSSSNEHTPIAPKAVNRLADFGMETILDESMWEPDSKTDKLIKKAGGDTEWMKHTFCPGEVAASAPSKFPSPKDVMVWSGSFKHGCYGSDVPAMRSVGIVDTSARKLTELLLDSNRVKEYNKMSLGRKDIVTFGGSFDEVGPFGKATTKVVQIGRAHV